MQKAQFIKNNVKKGGSLILKKKIQNQDLILICSLNTQKISILQLQSNYLNTQSLRNFNQANWSNLQQLWLFNNQIGNIGCKFISRASMNNLQWLSLNGNMIGSEGVLHISKAPFKNLKDIGFVQNVISCNGVEWINKGNWKTLQGIRFGINNVAYKQVFSLILVPSNNLKFIHPSKYNINLKEKQIITNIYSKRFHEIQVSF